MFVCYRVDLDYMLASPLSGLGSAARGPPSCSSTEIDDLGAEEQGGGSLLDAEGRALPSPDGTEASPGGEDLDGVGTGKEEELAGEGGADVGTWLRLGAGGRGGSRSRP